MGAGTAASAGEQGGGIRTKVKRGVVVIGPAWHSCGTYEVFRSQVRMFRSLGYSVYFLAVPSFLSASSHSKSFWSHFYDMTTNLDADERGHTARGLAPFAKPAFLRQLRAGTRGSFVNWRTLPARLAPLPASLESFLTAHQVDVVLCNHYFNVPLAERVRDRAARRGEAPKLILETHDIQTNHYVSEGKKNPLTGKVHGRDAMLDDEAALVGRAEASVHLNLDEFALFQERLPQRLHRLIFPPMPRKWETGGDDGASDAPDPEQRFDFLIVASANIGNYRNLCWFFDEVWSEALAARFVLKIVGNVDWEFTSRHDPRHENFRASFIGRVEKLDWFYRNTRAVLLPVIEGQGIAIKTIEALSFGKPVIGTPLAFRGFAAHLTPETIRGSVVDADGFRAQMFDVGDGLYPDVDWRAVDLYESLFSQEVYSRNYQNLLADAGVRGVHSVPPDFGAAHPVAPTPPSRLPAAAE